MSAYFYLGMILVSTPGDHYISRERIASFRSMTIEDLRKWLVHLHVVAKNTGQDHSEAVRDAMFVIYEKRKKKGEKNTPEEVWLRSRNIKLPNN